VLIAAARADRLSAAPHPRSAPMTP